MTLLRVKSRRYRVYLPTASRYVACPVAYFPGMAMSWTALWVHFVYRNVWDMIAVLEEGNLPLLQCPQYDMFVPWRNFMVNTREKILVPSYNSRCADGGWKKSLTQVHKRSSKHKDVHWRQWLPKNTSGRS